MRTGRVFAVTYMIPDFLKYLIIMLGVLSADAEPTGFQARLLLAPDGESVMIVEAAGRLASDGHGLDAEFQVSFPGQDPSLRVKVHEGRRSMTAARDHAPGEWLDPADPAVLDPWFDAMAQLRRGPRLSSPVEARARALVTIPVRIGDRDYFAHYFEGPDPWPDTVWFGDDEGSVSVLFLPRRLEAEADPPDCEAAALEFRRFAQGNEARLLGIVMGFEDETTPITPEQVRKGDIQLMALLLEAAGLDAACAEHMVDRSAEPGE